jgi:class 3 adenylate cyclase
VDRASIMNDVETRHANSASGRIAYQVVGDGPVTILVYKPALFPIDLMWEEPALARFVTGLASFSRSIWFDPRGTGSSDATDEADGALTETAAADMLAVLDDIGCERAVIFGINTPPALLFAATHPERTEALVLYNASARRRRADDYPEGIPHDVVDKVSAGLAREDAYPIQRLIPAPSMIGNARFERWCRRAVRLSGTPTHRLWRLRSTLEADLRSVLPAIRVPTLVCRRGGTESARAQGRYVAEHIEGARSVELPGDDDLFFAGDPSPLLDAIEEFVTGSRPAHRTDRVLATVMFTDIIGSTEHATCKGDRRWRELLATHDAVLRAELQHFDGHEVKTIGDGLLATFDSPDRALRCAAAMRDAVRSLGIEIRIGLHTGEIDLCGRDIGGIAVHIAERVESSAGPSEIVVSRTVVDLVTGSGLRFTEHETHELRGIPGHHRLYTLAT